MSLSLFHIGLPKVFKVVWRLLELCFVYSRLLNHIWFPIYHCPSHPGMLPPLHL